MARNELLGKATWLAHTKVAAGATWLNGPPFRQKRARLLAWIAVWLPQNDARPVLKDHPRAGPSAGQHLPPELNRVLAAHLTKLACAQIAKTSGGPRWTRTTCLSGSSC